jgi:hypothetical protein
MVDTAVVVAAGPKPKRRERQHAGKKRQLDYLLFSRSLATKRSGGA